MNIAKVATLVIIGCTIVVAETARVDAPLPPVKDVTVAWRETFVPLAGAGAKTLPKNWVIQGKPGTLPAAFWMATDPGTTSSFLHMEADSGSASLITNAAGIDLAKTPILRWRWRVTALPPGADGRVRSKDDQAIGIYVGTGSTFSNKSISYRWDTETPKGASGKASYGLGAVKVKWRTVRNKEDAQGAWFIEERNLAEDFREAWGFYPKELYVSVSCNSQYTGSRAAADLGWIEFVSLPPK